MELTIIPSVVRAYSAAKAGVQRRGYEAMETTVGPDGRERTRLDPRERQAVETAAKVSVGFLVAVAALSLTLGTYSAYLCARCNPARKGFAKALHCAIAFLYGPIYIPLYSMFGDALCRSRAK